MQMIKKLVCTIALAAALFCAMAVSASAEGLVAPELSQGQQNIVKRARQMLEIEWSPIHDRYQWAQSGVFAAGSAYTGVPYGQAVNAYYVGFDATFSEFMTAVNTSSSLFYTSYSTYNQIAPYYSGDCSALVSYAWGLESRMITRTLPEASDRLQNQSLSAIEVGDALNNSVTHVILITGLRYDTSGALVTVEVIEQTPNIARKTVYGTGGMRTLSYFENFYLGGGYQIYRNPNRDLVTYTHDCAVPIDGDFCASCKESAPRVTLTGSSASRTAVLTHKKPGATIYYTTDGSEPTTASSVYTAPLTFSKTTTVRAIAVTSDFSDSWVLTFQVVADGIAAPTYTHESGTQSGTSVSAGSTIALHSATSGATIHYTTDGSTPTVSSTRYTAPIAINHSMTIKAVAVSGSAVSAVSSFSFSVETADVHSSFSDVRMTDWHYDAVNFVVERGFFNGTAQGVFSPNMGMTRGMFITVVGRMAEISGSLTGNIGVVTMHGANIRTAPGADAERIASAVKNDALMILGEENGWYKVLCGGETGYIAKGNVKIYDEHFTDLDKSQYYSAYVQWAYLIGILGDNPSSTFSANENISREDMAMILHNFVMAEGLQIGTQNARESFLDDAEISHEKSAAVYALQQAGVINGMGDGTFSPYGEATRAQVATIFMKFLSAVG